MGVCRASWLLAGGLILSSLNTFALGADASSAIARLLDVGWSVTPQARADADVQYDEVRRLAGADPRALEASWLVLMQQRRFEEALKRIDEHLAKKPDEPAALRAKTWIQAVLKNYSAAFILADKLSALIASHPPTTETDRAAQDELVGFLGRLMGFFGGPAADLINQEERKALEKKLLDRLDTSERPVFEDARNSVLSRFIEMTDESASARQRAAATAKAEKEKTLAELQADKEKLDGREKELEENRTKANSELRAELEQIAKQDQPLLQQQTQLASRANFLNSDLLNTSSQMATLQQLAAQEKNPMLQQQYYAQINSLSLIASRIDADLFSVNRSLQGIQSQRAGLAVRRNQAQATAANQVDRIDRELAELGKRERRNEGLEKRANRPSAPTTSKLRALSSQATALSTYDSFPLEAAKAKLLDSLLK